MIFVNDKYYAKVWTVTKQEKYIDIQMSTSEKDKDGNYINSSWYARAIGHAANTLKDLKEKDRIVVTKSKITNEKYTAKDGTSKSATRVIILEAEIEGAKEAPTPIKAETSSAESSEDSPW